MLACPFSERRRSMRNVRLRRRTENLLDFPYSSKPNLYYNSTVGRFWNLVLTINSALLVAASLFLVYSFGTMLIFFEWKKFVLALTIFVVLIGTEMVFNTLCHD